MDALERGAVLFFAALHVAGCATSPLHEPAPPEAKVTQATSSAPATHAASAGSASSAPAAPAASADAASGAARRVDAEPASSSVSATGPSQGTPLSPAPGPLNVILITIDAMRADMPWAGYPRDIAPNLTALEKASVSYTRAYSVSSSTAMSFAGLLSGRYPSELERSGSFFSAHPDSVEFFPERLQRAGVRTVAAHAHFYFEKKAGFHQGFDAYRMVEGLSADNTTDKNVTSPQHLALAKELLGDEHLKKGPFFAWFHFMDAHDLYVSHPGIDFGKKPRDRYDGELRYLDGHLGELFAFIEKAPWASRTAVIVTADHGEAFGEHKMTRHGFELWEPLVHVPLFAKIPGLAPKRIDTPRSAIDLAPTILDLLGVPADASYQGQSLVAELAGTALPEERDVIVDLPRTGDNFRRRALVRGRYKLISHDDDFRLDLYDLGKDPGETRELRQAEPDVYRDMKRRYEERRQRIKDICPKRRDNLKGKRPEKPC